MADIKAKEERVERSPAWKAHLAELAGISQAGDASFFPAGTKTMRHHEMDSANKRHTQSIAAQTRGQDLQYKAHAERLAHDRWFAGQRLELDWAAHNATMTALEQAAKAAEDPYGVNNAESVLQSGQAVDRDTINAHGMALGYHGSTSHFGRHFDVPITPARMPSSGTATTGNNQQSQQNRAPLEIRPRSIQLPKLKWDNPFSPETWRP